MPLRFSFPSQTLSVTTAWLAYYVFAQLFDACYRNRQDAPRVQPVLLDPPVRTRPGQQWDGFDRIARIGTVIFTTGPPLAAGKAEI
jgi:hypothetical protein